MIAQSYSRWIETIEHLAGKLSVDERQQLFGDTPEAAYKLQRQSEIVNLTSENSA
jgi:predicted TIM-barrel fold metal-dependent hydrolase